jgi:hypothetical protein
MTARAWLLAAAGLVLPATLSAHRLDEYLQATRIAVSRERADLDVDLTPGVSVASSILPLIDRNGDDRVSPGEADAYAAAVLRDLDVSLDGRPAPLELRSRDFPDVQAMREGVGVIRMSIRANLTGTPAGTHQLLFRNRHRRDIGVYLANALVPDDLAVSISAQDRDARQHELRIDYEIVTEAPRSGSMLVAPLVAAAGVLGVLLWRRRLRTSRS